MTLKAIIFLSIIITTLSISHQAQAQTYQLNIHNVPFSCYANNGQPVPIFFSNHIQGARADLTPQHGYTIGINLDHLNNMHPLAAIFTAFHECGHVALSLGVGLMSPNQEINADCFAIQNMRRIGLIRTQYEFENAISVILNSSGSMLHPPGHIRRQLMTRCL